MLPKMEWKFDLVMDLEHQLSCDTLIMSYFQCSAVFLTYILVGDIYIYIYIYRGYII
jgi:hypothetical protein